MMDVTPADEEAELNFLHPHGPSPSYCYPRHSDTLRVHVSDILTHVHRQLTLVGPTNYQKRILTKFTRHCIKIEHVKREVSACEYIYFIIR